MQRFWRWRQRILRLAMPGRFALYLTVERLVVSSLLVFVLGLFWHEAPRPDLGQDWIADLLSLTVFAPIFETLVFQFLIIVFLRWLGAGYRTQIAISALAFAWAHFAVTPLTGLIAGGVGGLYLGYIFARWLPHSKWTAYWTTALSHALGNGVLFLIMAVGGVYR